MSLSTQPPVNSISLQDGVVSIGKTFWSCDGLQVTQHTLADIQQVGSHFAGKEHFLKPTSGQAMPVAQCFATQKFALQHHRDKLLQARASAQQMAANLEHLLAEVELTLKGMGVVFQEPAAL